MKDFCAYLLLCALCLFLLVFMGSLLLTGSTTTELQSGESTTVYRDARVVFTSDTPFIVTMGGNTYFELRCKAPQGETVIPSVASPMPFGIEEKTYFSFNNEFSSETTSCILRGPNTALKTQTDKMVTVEITRSLSETFGTGLIIGFLIWLMLAFVGGMAFLL